MGGRRGNGNFVAACNRWSAAMPQPNDLSRSLVALDQNSTIIAVIEMSQSSWPVAGVLPGIERQPRKKLEPNAEGSSRIFVLAPGWSLSRLKLRNPRQCRSRASGHIEVDVMVVSLSANVRNRRKRRDTRTDREGPQSTHGLRLFA
jgi:hypothetical protein